MNQYTNPLTARVAQAIVGRGMTIEQVAKLLDLTREQARSSLKNAVNRGLVEVVSRSGRGRGKSPTIYRGVERPAQVLKFNVSCVWDLGSQRIVKLPRALGQVYQPLGEW